jgi:multisubunit Na+/H+ antiporter MnhB subunit
MSARNIAAVIFFAVITVFLVVAVLMTHPFGSPDDPEMDQYIIENTQSQTGADNGVTSVVFDYRGFDTLGEATVLFTAVAGVILVFRRLKE